MTTDQSLKKSRLSCVAIACGLLMPAINAQSATPMPADIVKPIPKMDMKPSSNTDVDVAMMMRVHHRSANTMAEAELQGLC